MASVNKKVVITTHQGGKAKHITPLQQLRRSVMSCMLWENTFYEDGIEISERIKTLATQVTPEELQKLTLMAKWDMGLRHIPLYLTSLLPSKEAGAILPNIITRADDLAEFLSMYWKAGKHPISASIKRGLAKSFEKFDEYQLAKYNGGSKAIRLRDVMRMVHPKPKDQAQSAMWKRLIKDELKTPDTWEVALSAGQDKKETWLRLIKENKLGGLAALRNLRNMIEAGLTQEERQVAIEGLNASRLLPINFIAAARYDVKNEIVLEKKFLECFDSGVLLQGKTLILIDVSGSMNDMLSAKSEMSRLDVACSLAMIAREKFQLCSIVVFSEEIAELPPRRGFALRDAILNSIPRRGTYLGNALNMLATTGYERIIVITDEQSADKVPDPVQGARGYMINVNSNKNGVGYGAWVHIDGWSDATIRYIEEYER